MNDTADLRTLLAEARARIAAGRLAEARGLLDRLRAEPDGGALGPPTVLGMPRKLHAAFLKLAKAEGDVLTRIGLQQTLVPPPDLLAHLGHFTTLERAALAEAGRAAVPRLLHQIWIGPRPPPETTEAWRRHAARHGLSYRLWREADLAAIGVDRHPVFQAMAARGDMPGAVDVARYAVLSQVGGLYLDCDWYPARETVSFHHRLPLVGLTCIAEDIPRQTGAGSVLLSNAFIAAPARHPLFTRLLDALPAALAALPDAPAWWSTGPLLFTVVCRAAAVTIADAALVAGSAPAGTGRDRIRELCAEAEARDAGLLLAWKPWQSAASGHL